MNPFLIQAILIAAVSDEESNFWMQTLVFVLVAVGVGIYSLVKDNKNKHKDQQQNHMDDYPKPRRRFAFPNKPKTMVQQYIAKKQGRDIWLEDNIDFDSLSKNPAKKLSAQNNKDLQSGMELLELDFLISVVEKIKGKTKNDITIRKLNFNELARRQELSHVKSKPLTTYAIDKENLYGKDIQCKAMTQLSQRTTPTKPPHHHQTPISPRKRKKRIEAK
jgi:cell division septation protein DedD